MEDSISELKIQKLLEVYSLGEMSLCKLAQELNIDPVTARDFLRSHGIPIQSDNVQSVLSDVKNA